ncbi:MAG: phosphoribosylformylglycinamidine cyclo-ligase [Acidobacteriota bacterium]
MGDRRRRSQAEKSWTYRDAGVDLKRAGEAKERIKALARSTFNSAVPGDIGSFGGLYRPDFARYQKPILVSSVDGVGTKLKVAFMAGVHDTVGVDLVSHCCNDILTQGALPLFFMDYIATGRLDPQVVEKILSGLVQGCRRSQCVLLGGETAEMPDFYPQGEYDLAGFMVGVADESRLLDRRRVAPGDILIGLPSSGLHTNGFSLVRKLLLEQEKLSLDSYRKDLGKTLGEELLTPHRSYLSILKELVQTDELAALAHITGGGITENLNRVLPNTVDALVRRGTWEILPIFRLIRDCGRVTSEEMYRTFNMGLGMILLVGRRKLSRVESFLQERGERYYLVGEIIEGGGRVRYDQAT